MYEFPPILQGDEKEQLKALRDYLVRMTRDLDSQVEKIVVQTVQGEASRQRTAGGGGTASVNQEAVNRLRSLIVKTADTIQQNIDLITTELHEDYLAVSDFGQYREDVDRRITDTARYTDEQFTYLATTIGNTLESYMESIRGEIRRGFIESPPGSGQYVIGIAISQELHFKANSEREEGGLTYYELESGQTFGFYTSTGWQYWIGGVKVGWFDSQDRMLHVGNALIEESLTIGDGWLITTTGGFGIRKVG